MLVRTCDFCFPLILLAVHTCAMVTVIACRGAPLIQLADQWIPSQSFTLFSTPFSCTSEWSRGAARSSNHRWDVRVHLWLLCFLLFRAFRFLSSASVLSPLRLIIQSAPRWSEEDMAKCGENLGLKRHQGKAQNSLWNRPVCSHGQLWMYSLLVFGCFREKPSNVRQSDASGKSSAW